MPSRPAAVSHRPTGASQDTLPDYLRPGLRLLSIGLNPSLPSVAAGFYFANPRNRFWKALNASGLLERPVEPGADGVRLLFESAGIGFTDLVKRPTRGAAQLRALDYRSGALRLAQVLRTYQPAIAWFHGKLAYGQFLKCTGTADGRVEWGLQAARIGASEVFVTPNPSPANAAFSLQELVAWYDRLANRLAVQPT
jgi:TDG/mug DNA glycosylase family protein